jgi:hypothetical protein
MFKKKFDLIVQFNISKTWGRRQEPDPDLDRHLYRKSETDLDDADAQHCISEGQPLEHRAQRRKTMREKRQVAPQVAVAPISAGGGW